MTFSFILSRDDITQHFEEYEILTGGQENTKTAHKSVTVGTTNYLIKVYNLIFVYIAH